MKVQTVKTALNKRGLAKKDNGKGEEGSATC